MDDLSRFTLVQPCSTVVVGAGNEGHTFPNTGSSTEDWFMYVGILFPAAPDLAHVVITSGAAPNIATATDDLFPTSGLGVIYRVPPGKAWVSVFNSSPNIITVFILPMTEAAMHPNSRAQIGSP